LEARPDHGETVHVHAYAHEGTDTSVHNVAVLAGAFVGLLIFGFIVGYGTFKILSPPETVSGPPALIETSRTLPPGPRLQVNAPKDLADYLSQQQHALDTYGWVDQKAGVVRIPIDRAMDLLVQKGLPVRAELAGGAPASQTKATTGAGKQTTAPTGTSSPSPNPSGRPSGEPQ
jgi:hypothetical protein